MKDLTIRSLSKTYFDLYAGTQVTAVHDISLDVPAGERTPQVVGVIVRAQDAHAANAPMRIVENAPGHQTPSIRRGIANP